MVSDRRTAIGTPGFVAILVMTVLGVIASVVPHVPLPSVVMMSGMLRVLALGVILAGGTVLARNYQALGATLTAQAASEAQARTDALTDELTGIYNRRGFRALAEHQIRIARRTGSDVMLLYIDVDGFKQINDRHGHAAGDSALRDVAALLRQTMRETDVLARLGGDEFALLVIDADPATEQAVRGRIARAIVARNAVPSRPFPIAITIGAATLDADRSAHLDELLAASDRALYAAKRRRSGVGA